MASEIPRHHSPLSQHPPFSSGAPPTGIAISDYQGEQDPECMHEVDDPLDGRTLLQSRCQFRLPDSPISPTDPSSSLSEWNLFPTTSYLENQRPGSESLARKQSRLALLSRDGSKKSPASQNHKPQNHPVLLPTCSIQDLTTERIRGDALIVATIRTNVIINDEFTVITDMSHLLSDLYQRSVTSIVVTLAHSACMLFGGSFDTAYVITISSLDGYGSRLSNSPTAALLQQHIYESLGVPPSRGYVQFCGVEETDIAQNGSTIRAAIAASTQETAPTMSPESYRPKTRMSVKGLGSFLGRPGSAVPKSHHNSQHHHRPHQHLRMSTRDTTALSSSSTDDSYDQSVCHGRDCHLPMLRKHASFGSSMGKRDERRSERSVRNKRSFMGSMFGFGRRSE